eukprot:TRINITY_DN14545_c0_g5_i1.p1 TRINITY_DN14545_c0_g5~~TRINITY_DN14545_c0_g5_i1.p1  ORF type:complete len:274 (+),score=89.48 TRINITY_DN14545_c0_g5_i1:77-898(+)
MAANETQAEPDACVSRVLAASALEGEAVELDRRGDRVQAAQRYEACLREFDAAIEAAKASGAQHAGDLEKLEEHRRQVRTRIEHLKSSEAKTVPVEDQIKTVQLAMSGAASANAAASTAGGVKQLAAIAAIGAVGGGIVLGSALGLTTIGVVGGAAGATICATRADAVGDAARKAGSVAVAAGEKAVAVNKDHRITEKIGEVSSKAVHKAAEVNRSYGITDKLVKGASAAVSKGKAFEEKHHLTDKAAAGVVKGLDKVSSVLGAGAKKLDSGK